MTKRLSLEDALGDMKKYILVSSGKDPEFKDGYVLLCKDQRYRFIHVDKDGGIRTMARDCTRDDIDWRDISLWETRSGELLIGRRIIKHAWCDNYQNFIRAVLKELT